MADAGDSKSPAPRGREGSTPSSGTRRAFWILFAVALLVHLPARWQYTADPFSRTLVSDALSYDAWAGDIVEQGLGAQAVFHQAPLYPLLLSSIYRATGPAARWNAAIGVGILLDALAIALLVPIGAYFLGSPAAGTCAALLVLLHGPFVFHALKLLPVPLALASQAAALAALGVAKEKAGSLWSGLAGAALGVAALARSEVLLFVPFAMACVATARPMAFGRRALLASSLLAGVALGVAPATLHNFQGGDFVLVASSGGENLYIGNRRGAQGEYTPLHPKAGDLFSERILAREVAEKESGRSLRPSEISAYWRRKAVAEVLEDPFGWLQIEAKKLGRVLHPGDPTDMYSFPLERSLYLTTLHALFLPSWFLLVSAGFGAVAALRARPRRAWPLAAFAGVQLLVLLVFFVSTRLRLPFLFSIAPFAGFGLVRLFRAWREGERRGRLLLATAALVLVGVLGATLTRARPRDHVRLAAVLSTQGRLDEGLRVLEPPLSSPNPDSLTLDQAGWLLQKKGDFAGARDRYRQALAAGMPGGRAVQTRTRLAMALEGLGAFDEAALEHDVAIAEPEANAGTYYERGAYRVRRGQRDAGLRDLEEAVRRDPSWDVPRKALFDLRRG